MTSFNNNNKINPDFVWAFMKKKNNKVNMSYLREMEGCLWDLLLSDDTDGPWHWHKHQTEGSGGGVGGWQIIGELEINDSASM